MKFANAREIMSGLIVMATVGLWLVKLALEVRPHPSVELLGPLLVVAAAITFFGSKVVRSAFGLWDQYRKQNEK